MRTLFFLFCAFVLAGVAAAADLVVPNRLGRARAGEWLIVQDVHNLGATTKITVARVNQGAGEVVLLRENLDANGAVTDSKEIPINMVEYNQRRGELERNAKSVTRETLVIKDKEITAYAVTWDQKGDDGQTTELKVWISDDIPVGGVAKSWSSDAAAPAVEVIDYGF